MMSLYFSNHCGPSQRGPRRVRPDAGVGERSEIRADYGRAVSIPADPVSNVKEPSSRDMMDVPETGLTAGSPPSTRLDSRAVGRPHPRLLAARVTSVP